MNTAPHTHRRRFYVRQMVNSLQKALTKFRKAKPQATVEEQKLHAFETILGLTAHPEIAIMPVGMTHDDPPLMAFVIANPERADMPKVSVAI